MGSTLSRTRRAVPTSQPERLGTEEAQRTQTGLNTD